MIVQLRQYKSGYIGISNEDTKNMNEWYYIPKTESIGQRLFDNHSVYEGNQKILFTTPDLKLEGVPLIDFDIFPQVKEISEINEMASQVWGNVHRTGVLGFIDGYTKAKETYKFTEEDIRKALSESFKASIEGYRVSTDEIIEQLSKPKIPVSVDIEIEHTYEEFLGKDCISGFNVRVETISGEKYVIVKSINYE